MLTAISPTASDKYHCIVLPGEEIKSHGIMFDEPPDPTNCHAYIQEALYCCPRGLLLDVRGKTPKLTDRDVLISSWKTRGQLKTRTPRYAALSYCWGTPDDAKAQLKTTRSSFSEWQTGIDTQKTTPVLRDAITITKKLSIPYLWIDSLCIFQDDIEDWNRQCTDMDKIYGHAEITIAAASSKSYREGFIQHSAPGVQLPFQSIPNQELHGSIWIEFREVEANIDTPPLSAISSDVYGSGSRLATRGWAIQERVLSTRQIVFGKLNLYFICPRYYQSKGGRVSLGRFHSTIHPAREERNEQELYLHWAHLLGEFNDITANSFTCATDLLPSMSGMAADFAKRLKDNYVAGHWGDDLVMGLMWNLDLSLRASKSVHLGRICSPTQYLAPSWSQLSQFAAKSGLRGIDWIKSYHPAVEYISAHTTLKEEDNAFGAITSGELHGRGYFMNLRAMDVLRFNSMEPFMRNWVHQNCRWILTFERYDVEICCEVRLDYDLPIAEIHEEVQSWILLGTYKSSFYAARTEGKEDDMYPFGLLVHRIGDSEWCRIGTFEPARGELGSSRLSLQTFQSASRVEDITII